MLKIYRNNESTSTEITHIVISSGGGESNFDIRGCLIYDRDNRYKGYNDRWNKGFFRELKLGEEIEIDLNRTEFINGKLFIKGNKYKDCIIDLNENTIETYDENDHKVKLRFKKKK